MPSSDSSAYSRLDRLDLMVWRDDQGKVHPVRTLADWDKRRRAILIAMQDIMGPAPVCDPDEPLEMKILDEQDMDDHVRRLVTYKADAALPTPAYLLIPKDVLQGRRQATAILCLHPTQRAFGHKAVVAGLGAKADYHYASELARRGHVTLAPSYPHLADYEPDLDAMGYVSGTMKAIHDNRRGMDLLQSLPGVRPGGIGAIGHSLGGHNALYTAAFDSRLAAVVTSCGLDLYVDYFAGKPEHWEAGQGWTQHRYMPRLTAYQGRLVEIPFDFAEILGVVAPRGVFVNAPLHDTNFDWQSVDRLTEAARPIYNLHDAADALKVIHPDCGHDFLPDARQQAYAFLEHHLHASPR